MKKLFVLFGFVLTLAACGSFEQTVQVQDKAYLLIIGDPSDSVVTIDNGKILKNEYRHTYYFSPYCLEHSLTKIFPQLKKPSP